MRSPLAILAAFALTACNAETALQEAPSDFAITAEFIASAMAPGAKSWTLTVERDGRVTREAHSRIPSTSEFDTKHPRLTPEQLSGLARTIAEVRFFDIPDTRTNWTDPSANFFRVTMNGKTREVRSNGLLNKDVRDTDAGKRTRKLWWELLQRVPAPDPEHGAKYYKP
jgi:hypothetical protein